jgi:hypothetical protein
MSMRFPSPPVLVVALLLAVGAPSASAAGAACKPPKGAKVQAANGQARVYVKGSGLFGCLRSSGKTTRVAKNYDDDFVQSGSFDRVRLAGPFVAFSFTAIDVSCKADCPPDYDSSKESVHIYDLRTGKGRSFEVDATAFDISPKGALAWTAVSETAGWDLLLVQAGSTTAGQLDTGPVSLYGFRGTALLWTNGNNGRWIDTA